MTVHEFELILFGGPDLESFTEIMAEAMWNKDEDCSPGISCGIRDIGFYREAKSLEDAVLSAIEDVINKGLGSRVVLARDTNNNIISTPTIIEKIENQESLEWANPPELTGALKKAIVKRKKKNRTTRKQDEYEAVDRMLEWLKTATPEEQLAMLCRAGIINEKNELTWDYGGTGDPPKCKRKLPM